MNYPNKLTTLVSAAWLSQAITQNEGALIICEIVLDAQKTQVGIPGRIIIPNTLFEIAPEWNQLHTAKVQGALAGKGITSNANIIIYSRNITLAYRATLIFMNVGIQNVKVLDGGFAAWELAGYPISSALSILNAEDIGSISGNTLPDYLINTFQLKSLMKADVIVLADVRSEGEYLGHTSGYDYIQAKGRIPGARWARGGDAQGKMKEYRNPDGTMRALVEIAAFWEAEGITPDRQIVFYCGTGWRASEAFMAAYFMGWSNILIYDGGWLQWEKNETE